MHVCGPIHATTLYMPVQSRMCPCRPERALSACHHAHVTDITDTPRHTLTRIHSCAHTYERVPTCTHVHTHAQTHTETHTHTDTHTVGTYTDRSDSRTCPRSARDLAGRR